MRITIALLACLAGCCLNAQAERYSYRFAATITSVQDCVNPFSCKDVDSYAIKDATVALGQTVHGQFTYETNAPSYLFVYDDYFSAKVYESVGSSSGTYAAFSYNETSLGNMGDEQTEYLVEPQKSVGQADRFLYSASYWTDTDYQSFGISMYDDDANIFDSTFALHALPLEAMERADFSYGYFLRGPGNPLIRAGGALTEIQLISSVPEPSTYAMLAAGLGLLAWRRKTTKVQA
jgi:hypothetical protein